MLGLNYRPSGVPVLRKKRGANLLVTGLTNSYAEDGDTITASVSNPQDGVAYTFRYDFPGGSSSGASYTVDFAGDSLSQGDEGTVVMLADGSEVATRSFTFGGIPLAAPPVAPAAPTFADTITDDTSPALLVGAGITDTIQLYIDSEPANATYDSGAGTLTPNGVLPVGTYDFTVSHENEFGEGEQSPALSLQITNTPVLDFVGVTGPDGSNDYDVQVLLAVPEGVPSTLYIHVDLDTDPIPNAAAIIAGTGAVETFSEALTGDETNLTFNMTGLTEVDHRLTAVVVVDANNDIASAILSDTFTPPAAAAVSPTYLGMAGTTGEAAFSATHNGTADMSAHNAANEVVLMISTWGSSSSSISSVTLDGVSATSIVSSNAGTLCSAYATFPAQAYAASSAVVVTSNNSQFAYGVAVYDVPAGKTISLGAEAGSPSPTTVSANVLDGEGVIVSAIISNGDAPALVGVTEDDSVDTRTTEWFTVGSALATADETPRVLQSTSTSGGVNMKALSVIIGA